MGELGHAFLPIPFLFLFLKKNTMKSTSRILSAIFLAMFIVSLSSCGGGQKENENKEPEKVVLSEKGELLCSQSWKLDPNATLKGTTDTLQDKSNITANIELKEDVKKIADFVSETVVFGIDSKNPTKMSYSRTIGEGFFSVSALGFWNFNEDESAVIMREWSDAEGKEMEPVTYKIVELTSERLVLLKEGDVSPNIYYAK
jgi:ABC-type lipoprotein release transport system permease subunit